MRLRDVIRPDKGTWFDYVAVGVITVWLWAVAKPHGWAYLGWFALADVLWWVVRGILRKWLYPYYKVEAKAAGGSVITQDQWMPCPRCASKRTRFDQNAANDVSLGRWVVIRKIAATLFFLFFIPIIGWLLIPSVWANRKEFSCLDCALEWNRRDLLAEQTQPS